MKSKKLITFLSLSALVLAAVFGAAFYHSAKAASASASQAGLVAAASTAIFERGRGPGGGYTNEELANALGITLAELTAAQQKAKEAVLAQAVEKGLITQAQADRLKADDTSKPFGRHMGSLLNPADLAANGIDYQAELAKALGITVEKLQAAALQAFNSHLDQAVTDGKLTQEQADLIKGQNALNADPGFQTSMETAYKAAVAQAVKDGVITQAQADLILKNTSGFRPFQRPQGMLGLGGFEGRPGGRHGGWDSEQPAAPSTP